MSWAGCRRWEVGWAWHQGFVTQNCSATPLRNDFVAPAGLRCSFLSPPGRETGPADPNSNAAAEFTEVVKSLGVLVEDNGLSFCVGGPGPTDPGTGEMMA